MKFQKEDFIKAANQKSIGMFLEWFTETSTFSSFIDDCIKRKGKEKGNSHMFINTLPKKKISKSYSQILEVTNSMK